MRTDLEDRSDGAAFASRLLSDGIYTLGGRILRSVLALALGILTARVLGPYERGLYALPTAVYTGLVVSLFSGISVAVSYFMLSADGGRHALRAAGLTAVIFTVAGGLPVVAAAELAHNAWAAVPSILILATNAAGMILLGYAVGTKQIRWQTNYAVASAAALLAAIGAAFALSGHTAAVAVMGYVTASAVVAAGSIWFVVRDSQGRSGSPISLRSFIAYALRTGIVNLVTQLNYRADLYIVALLASAVVLGQYAVAISAAEGLLILTQVAAIVTSPHVGSMHRGDAAQLTATCVRATLLVAAPLCALVWAASPTIVRLLYGAAYLPLVPALRVLLVAVLILSVASPISNFFTLNRGQPEVALLSAICAAAVCIGLSWVLVPRIGMVGAATATALAYGLGEGLRITFFVKATGTPLQRVLLPTRADIQLCASAARSAVGVVRLP